MNDQELKHRLTQWATAFGGTQFLRLGYAEPGALPEHGGPTAPDASPDAEDIERIVRKMEQSGRWRESRVLRAEYFMAGLPEPDKGQRLSRIGLTMSRAAYYTYLSSATAFVFGAVVCSQSGGEAESCCV